LLSSVTTTMALVPRYSKFYGFETPLSNTRFSRIEMDGIRFHSVEQYFNYHKAKYFGQEDLAQKIMEAATPMDAYRLGRDIKMPDPCENPEEEEEWALKTMEKGLWEKVRL
jgi:ribA/ribD-fused uncharacterized protein